MTSAEMHQYMVDEIRQALREAYAAAFPQLTTEQIEELLEIRAPDIQITIRCG